MMPPDLGRGDLVVGALARMLDRLHDRLAAEGLADPADLVAELADEAHDFTARRGAGTRARATGTRRVPGARHRATRGPDRNLSR